MQYGYTNLRGKKISLIRNKYILNEALKHVLTEEYGHVLLMADSHLHHKLALLRFLKNLNKISECNLKHHIISK